MSEQDDFEGQLKFLKFQLSCMEPLDLLVQYVDSKVNLAAVNSSMPEHVQAAFEDLGKWINEQNTEALLKGIPDR